MNQPFDCVVIGAGIAGCTAAIYLKRWNLNILVLEKNMPGGTINKTSIIENYPGIKNIDGTTLALNLYDQIQSLNINYKYGNVIKIEKQNDEFQIETDLEKLKTKSIIIATGRKPKTLNLENEEKLIGRGISYCATCDGPLYKDKEVYIVGGGNSALEESIYLSNICKKVTIVNRSSILKADNYLVEKVKKISNIDIMYNAKVQNLIEENNKLKSITINKEQESQNIDCDGLFIFIGFKPDIPNIEGINLDNGYIVVDTKMQTNIRNICACGDIIKKDLYQIITAAGEGAQAANTIKNNLNK